MRSHLRLALVAGVLLAALATPVACDEPAAAAEEENEEPIGAAAKRFDFDIAKKRHYFEEAGDVDKRFDPYVKRFDPYVKRFDPYTKRFDPYSKRFDPYSKRFDPFSKRFMTDRRRRFDLDLAGRYPGLDSRAFFVQLGR